MDWDKNCVEFMYLRRRLHVDSTEYEIKDHDFRVSIENDALSNVSVFKSLLYFDPCFQMSPFSIVSNGNTNLKTETFHSGFYSKTE